MRRSVVVSTLALSLLAASACARPPSTNARTDEPVREVAAAESAAQVSYYVVLAGPAVADVRASGASLAAQRATLRAVDAEQAALVPAIEATGAVVTARLRKLVNVVQVLAPESAERALAHLPGVVRVERVPMYERSNTSAVPFVGAVKAWEQASVHGEGVRIGIIDTGIDYGHADFGGPGTPEAYVANDPDIVEPGSFPTKKVVGGRDFVGDDYDPSQGKAKPTPDDDPLDCAGLQMMAISGGHGTHVAGTTAGQGVTADGKPFTGPYDQSFSPFAFRVGPGVAPAASLYALKVFGCSGGTTMTAAALDWASDPNDDGDLSDRLDVLNLSLGSSYATPTPTDEKLVKNLAKAGAFLAIAAGNEGNTFFVTGAPGTYDDVLSVAAVTDAISFGTLTVLTPASVAGDVPASEGSFTKPLVTSGKVTGKLVATKPANACAAVTNGAELAGNIAFIDRGTCTFVNKVKNAVAAGAVAVVVADNVESEVPFAMGGDGSKSTVPGVMIRKVHGDAIRPELGKGVTVVLDGTKPFPSNIGADETADFSSRGPRATDAALKPEIAAPGVAIDSAGVASGSEPRQLQGTSMATPVVAGAAALVRQKHPAYSPAEVKAALMNTAMPVTDGAGNGAPVSRVGAGRLAVDAALATPVTLAVDGASGAVAVSFGAHVVAKPTTSLQKVVATNHGTSAITYAAKVDPGRDLPGVSVTVTPATITVPAGGTAEMTLRLDVDPTALGAPGPDASTPPTQFDQPRHFVVEASGQLALSDAAGKSPAIHVPYYAPIRAAAERKVVLPGGCIGAGDLTLAIEGPSAHPNPVVSVLALGATSPEKPASADNAETASIDILATGAATNLPTATSFDAASLYFGVAVAGEWMTPTLGTTSVVTVELDVNLDGNADYAVRVVPVSRSTEEGPLGDVLAAVTYDLAKGTPTASRRFINGLSAAVLDTQPFLDGVLILPVTMKDIGLTKGKAKVAYSVVTTGPTKAGERSSWAVFDAEAPLVQPKGGVNGTPVFAGPGSVTATISAAADGTLPSLLLLHHTNVKGSRSEIVALGGAGNLKVSATTSGNTATFTVENQGTAARDGVTLTIASEGAATLTPSVGSCTATACALGSLPAGGTATVDVTPAAPGLVTATVSGTGCEASAADDTATADLGKGNGGGAGAAGQGGTAGAGGKGGTGGTGGSAGQPAADALEGIEPVGGCACEVARPTPRAPFAGLGLALAALALRRRRR